MGERVSKMTSVNLGLKLSSSRFQNSLSCFVWRFSRRGSWIRANPSFMSMMICPPVLSGSSESMTVSDSSAVSSSAACASYPAARSHSGRSITFVAFHALMNPSHMAARPSSPLSLNLRTSSGMMTSRAASGVTL